MSNRDYFAEIGAATGFVIPSEFVKKDGTSQLALLTQGACPAGIRRIKADLLRAERAEKPPSSWWTSPSS